MKSAALLVIAALAFPAAPASAGTLSIEIRSGATNPTSPQMGDHLSFDTTIRNDGPTPVDGVIAWISLVQIDKGHEQPVDLEDWSAHKAVTLDTLPVGGFVHTDWPMRLIQAGTYRLVVSAASRDGANLSVSPFADFSVRQKPVVESDRILPVALGLPMFLGFLMLSRWRRR